MRIPQGEMSTPNTTLLGVHSSVDIDARFCVLPSLAVYIRYRAIHLES